MQEDSEKKKSWSEDFAQFFENPSREKLRELLRNHTGERNELDFKEAWLDYREVARHMLAMANSSGGCIIFGMKDESFELVGLESFVDEANFSDGVEKPIPMQLKYSLHSFSYEDSEYPKLKGKKFQVLLIEDTPKYIPFMSDTSKLSTRTQIG